MQTYTHLNYSFNKVAKTVDITGFSWSIEQIKLITDISTATPTVIYDPSTAWLWWTLAWETLTLSFDTNTASFNNTDKLEIIIDQAITLSLADITHNEDSPHTSWDKWVMMLAIRSDSDAPTANEWDYTTLKLDEEWRLKVASKPASYPDITGDITAIQRTIWTPVAWGTVAWDVSRASNIMIFCSGTFAWVNCAFEGSLESTGDTNWFGVQVVRSNANTIETQTGALSAQPLYAWEASVNALKRFRVRAMARTSGTQSWRFVQGTYATEPIPAAQVTATQPVSWAVTVSSGTITSQWQLPVIVQDVASAAITSTTTTATITPTLWVSYSVAIPVTAVSGTNPTLDVVIQESHDNGTNWENVYQFPRITSTGYYVSPPLKLNGNRVRYVQTISGTTPSFTRSIQRLQSSHNTPVYRQLIDRSIVATTLNSTTSTFLARWCTKLQVLVDCGTMTIAPVLTFEGSMDGVSWFNIANNNATYTPTASTVNAYSIWGYTPLLAQFVRARVSTAGTTATINNIYFIGME